MVKGAWHVEARVRLSMLRNFVVVRHLLRLTRVVHQYIRSTLNMLAHARIATRMMIKLALSRAPPLIILSYFVHYLIPGKITEFSL